ncbi:hypothetical protein [Pseudonocardia sp. HH130630-07]|uniref:hypothetical protein n=1 Tax=Pseudonocardia sp. HH130630-07 TaxID=1690815 RepID=UPI000814E6B5|nr:hypothetical protein [Pseudonocardia sp. HH130630-07]ANY08314.1 hypothetical protein AFB00_20830 [Pseudonocardia sp. HH130630-07]
MNRERHRPPHLAGLVVVGAAVGDVSHYVVDAQMPAVAYGRPIALCGATFHPAALITPLPRLCRGCVAAARIEPPPRTGSRMLRAFAFRGTRRRG